MACEAWLRSIDGTGALACYADTLQRLYPRLEDVVARYVQRCAGGWHLDPQFFKDIGVEDEGHQRLFDEWFARGPSAPEESGDVAEAEAHCRRWLRAVDGSGGCERYAVAVALRFSHMGELVERYVRSTFQRGGNGASYELDPEFFDDVGISDPEHRQRFSEWFARGPPDPRGERYPAGIVELLDLGLEEWLRACDCGSGRLARHRMALRQNFDSVEQIVALYLSGGELDLEFFEDLGIDDDGDRKLFQAFIRNAFSRGMDCPVLEASESLPPLQPPSAFRGWSFAAWLREVACDTRTLAQYADRLEEQYDTVEQIVEIYSRPGDGGRCGLSGLLFADVGVEDQHHRALFEEWFARSCLPPSPAQEAPLDSGMPDPLASEHEATRPAPTLEHGVAAGPAAGSHGSAPEEGPSRRPRPDPGRFADLGSDFGAWLRLVGIPSDGAAFSRYLKANPRIKTVTQLIDQYLLCDPSGSGYVLDCQLFQEMDVQSTEHRQLIEDWLLGGWRDGAPSPCAASAGAVDAEATAQGPKDAPVNDALPAHSRSGQPHCGEQAQAEAGGGQWAQTAPPWVEAPASASDTPGPEAGAFARWLWEVDGGSGTCAEYVPALEDMYDTPEQVVRLYTESPGSTLWDAQFFQDAGIRKGHQPLFAQWLVAARGRSAAAAGVAARGSAHSEALPVACFEVVD